MTCTVDIPIVTVAELFDRLGGLNASSTALDARKGTVQQWKLRGRIPSRLYLGHSAVLAQRGITVSPSIWGLKSPAEAAAP